MAEINLHGFINEMVTDLNSNSGLDNTTFCVGFTDCKISYPVIDPIAVVSPKSTRFLCDTENRADEKKHGIITVLVNVHLPLSATGYSCSRIIGKISDAMYDKYSGDVLTEINSGEPKFSRTKRALVLPIEFTMNVAW